MLHIIYGDVDKENYIFDPDTYFNNQYEDEWITDDLSKRIIADIDNVFRAMFTECQFLLVLTNRYEHLWQNKYTIL